MREALLTQLKLLAGDRIIQRPEALARHHLRLGSLSQAGVAGIPQGALSEISGRQGAGKSGLVLELLAAHPGIRGAWIEPELTAYPRAFPSYGIAPDRILFVEAGKELLWSASQCLRSQLFGVVCLSIPGRAQVPETALRRLQLEARRSGAAVICLRDLPTLGATWPFSLQLKIHRRSIQVQRWKTA